MGILGFIIRRVILTIPVIIGVTFITFLLSFVFVPNVVVAWLGLKSSAAAKAALIASYHLNNPVYVQYYYYMSNLLHGNWGIIPGTGVPVLYDIEFFFPATVELAIASIIITIIIGIPMGVLAAMYHNRKADHSIRILYLSGYSSPPFFVALLSLLVFGYIFKIFPTQGELSSYLHPPTRITGMYIVDSLITGNWPVFQNTVWHIVLPATALSLTYFGVVSKITRASMLEVLQKDFIRASYAKGLTGRVVIYKHALRNALIPTTTVLGLLLGALLGGTVVIESIFQWPGIGFFATQAIENYQFPAVIGTTLIFTLAVVLGNLIADILYAVLDPRIKV
jgi:ABC-type dipeptide/oligopeptide/nickel transport system permease component